MPRPLESEQGLGRRVPKDWRHVEKYPYSAVRPEAVATVERVLALPRWHWSHDQGHEGSCVGHGSAIERAITNTAQNRVLRLLRPTRRYSALSIWNRAKAIDEWPDTNPGDGNGTSVRAAYDVLRLEGACREAKAFYDPVTETVVEVRVRSADVNEGIAAVRWATTVDEMRSAIASGTPVTIGVDWFKDFDNPLPRSSSEFVIGNKGWRQTRIRGGHCVCVYGASDRRQAFKVKNSWGRNYPLVWLTYEAMEGLLARDGEAALVTDR